MHKISTITAALLLISTQAQATEWVDNTHKSIRTNLNSWANSIDDWLGEPDPDKPASASVRVMLDNVWNRYDGYSIKPRVRGKIKLPVLKKHLNVVFGDESLDNEQKNKSRTNPNYRELDKNQHIDKKQVRNDNASVALRWSTITKYYGIKTDLDLGLRSGGDIYLRGKAEKEWKLTDRSHFRLEQIYRYGINSKHYLRTNAEVVFQEQEGKFIANHLYLEYSKDLYENVGWGNSLYRQHNFAGLKRLNYGLFFGGDIEKKKASLNTYGPFISWRQPIWKEWFFFQSEAHFYNNKKSHRPHHFGAFVRLEAIF